MKAILAANACLASPDLTQPLDVETDLPITNFEQTLSKMDAQTKSFLIT